MTTFSQFIAQIPGAEQAIDAAAKTGRYEPILIAIIVLAMLFAFGWLAKIILGQSAKREERMAAEAATERERFAVEKAELEKALIMLTEKVTTATTTAAVNQTRTAECLAEFSSAIKGLNGDIRDLCELLKKKTICPNDKRET